MLAGYMGKLLFVNLSTGEIKEERPDESFYRDYLGGYGIGVRILYSRQKAGVDPLGPDNTLGLISGPLTGTQVPTGARSYRRLGRCQFRRLFRPLSQVFRF
jgi:aldehyde:ferredoxin oxidoreductase